MPNDPATSAPPGPSAYPPSPPDVYAAESPPDASPIEARSEGASRADGASPEEAAFEAPESTAYVSPPVPSPSRARRYTDRGGIGAGGAGEVRLVHDGVLQRDVAIKLLTPDAVGNPATERAFVREARLGARLDHPNIVPVHDLGLDADGRAWFTMKVLAGKTFGVYARERSAQLGPSEYLQGILDVMMKVCDAVAFANAHGVVHCDLKPANIMVGAFGQVYVMDWGIARSLVPNPEETVVSGTPGFMSPEQAWARADLIDARTDVHGIGALLYFAMTGYAPYPGTSAEIRMEEARTGTLIPPDQRAPARRHPPALVQVVTKALAKDRDDRHQSVEELKEDLQRVMRSGWWFERRSFPAGTQVIRKGDPGDVAYILIEGRVRVHGADGVQHELGPGEVVGEAALLAGGARTADVVAVTDIVTRVVSREALDAELGSDSWLALFVRSLALRFSALDRALRSRPPPEAEALPQSEASETPSSR